MVDVTGLTVSFAVILGLNLLAAVLVWVEFSSNGFRYLKQAGSFIYFMFAILVPLLTLTDIKMPEMDGVTLARHIHARNPDLPIILISGNADASVELSGEEYLRFQFVQKPYGEQELLRLVGVCARQEQATPDATGT